VLNDVPLSARVFNEEPFGPVAAVRSFEPKNGSWMHLPALLLGRKRPATTLVA
jgi:hypothetical protein